jgi:hypothetical protein
MKKIFIMLLLLFTSVMPSYAVAGTPNLIMAREGAVASPSAIKQDIKTKVTQTKIDDLKQRGKLEITRRITFLNDLATKIMNLKKLSDADKTTFKTQIQQQVDGLTTLLTKIDADTDLTTLKTDVKSIVNGYYIFAFFRVKINLLVAAERLSVTEENMNNIYTKLLARVTDQKNQGKDVNSLEKLLASMLVKINDAKAQYAAAEVALSDLSAQGYPGNKSSLLSAKSKIKVGSQDLRSAFQVAMKVKQGLGDIGGNIKSKTGTHSAEIDTTPKVEQQ